MADRVKRTGDESDDRLLGDIRKAVDTEASSVIRPTETETLQQQVPAHIPQRIARYHIKSVIASGGMGTVYEATQDHPRRTVAVKVMKQGIASRSALRRFEYESQILARLRHPGIAQVFDAGTHRDGSTSVPYFAMEYIPNARPITQFAKEKKLGTRERMKLFAQACDAVHHGHQKGIIHRDLKPGNILVDAQGQVKIIDFGVARGTDSDLAITTLQTDIGQLIGTLQYMSPEQCEADPHDIDTRSDVYALGVVLYCMLSDQLPYDVGKKSIYEATRLIREQTPVRMSLHQRALRGDVETIVLKALEKDRDRRYQSALELGQDIERYLRSEPIMARPPSVVYHFSVFARRHKGTVTAVCALFVLLVSALVVTSSLYTSAERARQEAAEQRQLALDAQSLAEQQRDEATTNLRRALAAEAKADAEADTARIEARKAERISEFLTNAITSIQPSRAKGKEVTVRELVEQASERIATDLADEPLVRAEIEGVLTRTYEQLGLWEDAIKHADARAAILREQLGPVHIYTLKAEMRATEEYARAGRTAEALQRQFEVLSLLDNTSADSHPLRAEILARLGDTLSNEGRFADARPILEKAASIAQNESDINDALSAMIKADLARLYLNEGRNSDAVHLFREAARLREAFWGPDHPYTLRTESELSVALLRQGNPNKALPWAETAALTARKVLGDEHDITISAYDGLCLILERLDRFDGAEARALEILELHRSSADQPDLTIVRDYRRLLRIAHSSGDPARIDEYATVLISLLHEIADRSMDESSVLNEVAMGLLTVEPARYRDPENALRYATRAAELTQQPNAAILDTLARAQAAGGDFESAIATQHQALDLLPLHASSTRNELERTLDRIYAQGGRDGVEAYHRTLIRDRTREFGETHPDTIGAWDNLAVFLSQHEKQEESADIHKRLLELVEKEHGERCFDSGVHYGRYGLSLLNLGRPQEAEAPLRESVALFKKYGGEGSDQAVFFSSHYGDCLTRLGKFEEAETHLLNAQQSMEANGGRRHERTANNMKRLHLLYTKWGKPEAASVWTKRAQGLEQPN